MTRLDLIDQAIVGGGLLSFDYMRLKGGRKSIERRLVDPLGLAISKDGRQVLTAESAERDGRPRSFRVDRMFHTTIEKEG